MKQGLCLAVSAGVGIAELSCAAPSALQDSRPNILLIMTDDSGYSDLGCYGGEIHTPNLDRLARNGMRFTAFYNNARCSPSRASLMTGRDCARVGFGAGVLGGHRECDLPAYRATLNPDYPTVAELLKKAGYHTFMSGKWHLGGHNIGKDPVARADWELINKGNPLTEEVIARDFASMPIQRGFDQFFGILAGEAHLFVSGNRAQRVPGLHYPYVYDPDVPGYAYTENNSPAEIIPDCEYTPYCLKEKNRPYTEHPDHLKRVKAWYATDGCTDRAIDMLKQADRQDNRPFFMFLSYQAPHKPLQAPKELVDKYLPLYSDMDQIMQNRTDRLKQEGLFPGDADVRMPGRADIFDTDQFREMMALHAAMMEKVDENVGRVVEYLKQSGQFGNTLIIYLSDNGAASHVGAIANKPYFGCKSLLWEGGSRTACIMQWPGKIRPGSISHDIGWIGDFLPTFLELSGAAYPKQWNGNILTPPEGRSLVQALEGEETRPPAFIFWNDKGQQGCLHLGRWKFLMDPGWYNKKNKVGSRIELYDLENDPGETENVAARYPEMCKTLKKHCLDWQKRNGLFFDYADYGRACWK